MSETIEQRAKEVAQAALTSYDGSGANAWFRGGKGKGGQICKITGCSIEFAQEVIASQVVAALKAERKRAVEECANAYCRAYNELGKAVSTEDRGFRAILALISPPVPVWQHKPDCPTPYQWDAKNEIVVMPWYGSSTAVSGKHWTACPSCGAPKPQKAP
jgi:hypothetical protein